MRRKKGLVVLAAGAVALAGCGSNHHHTSTTNTAAAAAAQDAKVASCVRVLLIKQDLKDNTDGCDASAVKGLVSGGSDIKVICTYSQGNSYDCQADAPLDSNGVNIFHGEAGTYQVTDDGATISIQPQ